MPDLALQIRGVRKQFGGIVALEGIDLDVERGELVCLLGPSGCGKSTLLNAIAGFTPPSAGEILAFGKKVTHPEPERAMVFQEYALFPWMTVFENVAFGLQIRKEPRARIEDTVGALLRKLSLWDFRARFPKELSGGMRQRVAIARALALDAPTLLFDEPFGALDALTRRSLQDELLRVWSDLRKTALFVTHSIEESIHLADRVVVMTYRPGTVKRIVPIDLPRPRDAQSAGFAAIARQLTQLVMEEQQRHQSDELQRRE